jgi:hypothetical protein
MGFPDRNTVILSQKMSLPSKTEQTLALKYCRYSKRFWSA